MNYINEKWKKMPLEEPFHSFYEVSDHGRIRSVTRTSKYVRGGVEVERHVEGKILNARQSKKEPHHFVSLACMNPEDGNSFNKTVYNHKAMGLAFIKRTEKQKEKNYNKLTPKDGNHSNLHYTNWKWTNQSKLSIKQMKDHPENRNTIGDYQKKIGVPSDKIVKEVEKLLNLGFTHKGRIGVMVGKSISWGYSHVGKIAKDYCERIKDDAQSKSIKKTVDNWEENRLKKANTN